MPLLIVREDITRIKADAVVNPTDSIFSGSGGVDRQIHEAAGPGLSKACRKLGRCTIGGAVATAGYNLPCKYIIHTAGPVWQGGVADEEEKLASCYRSSLQLAEKKGCRSVAIPLIAAGSLGYPKEKALSIASSAINEFLKHCDLIVYLVVYDKTVYRISSRLFSDVKSYIDDNYVDTASEKTCTVRPSAGGGLKGRSCRPRASSIPVSYRNYSLQDNAEADDVAATAQEKEFSDYAVRADSIPDFSGIEEELMQIDESFSQMLLRKIDEKGMTDAQCYKKANIDRKLFSKIRRDKNYRPSKATVLAFAIALELSLSETKDMLMKAGFALSHSSKFDIIIEYFIKNRNYNIFEINETLFAFDQCLLGA
ncbi:MAG: macro domain-containing protein [Candidatus Limivicinus sp.]|jgi:O-acetyl-ADP-ribose deacetylase (regulator of RNase III)